MCRRIPCTAPRRRGCTFPPRKESERYFRRNTTLAGTWSTCRVCSLSRRGCTWAYRRGGTLDIVRTTLTNTINKNVFFAHVVISSFCHISFQRTIRYRTEYTLQHRRLNNWIRRHTRCTARSWLRFVSRPGRLWSWNFHRTISPQRTWCILCGKSMCRPT